MKTIGFEDIVDVILNVSDPNTWGVISQVPWVSSPKINAGVSVYNVEADGWIAWWSTNVSWNASDYNTVTWWSGNIYLPDWTSLAVTSGSTGNMSSMTYIYYDMSTNTVSTTTNASASVWENKILLCVAKPTSSWKDAEFQAFWTNAQSTFITADNIAANTITGNEIQANSITSGKIDVSQLSAISANLGTITAWDITWTTITAWSTSSTAVRMNPNNNRIEFYYWWSMVWYIAWASVDGNWGILINADYAGMIWRDVFDLYGGKLRLPVWTDLY
jgi:hypothetical protein